MKNNYSLKKDVNDVCAVLSITELEFSLKADISLRTLQGAYTSGASNEITEKIYNAIYESGLRLNRAKAELYSETIDKSEVLLFHGSKNGIDELTIDGSRENCDFGSGFYCSQFYDSALCFVENYDFSSVYLFSLSANDLSCVTIPPSIDWMIIVCYFRGMLTSYSDNSILKRSLDLIKDKDLIIAPIADNRMFQIMREFGLGEITDQQAIHALSASRLGNQYVFKTKKALKRLNLLERLYISRSEREKSIKDTLDRKNIIDTKLRLSKREFKNCGVYIDEVFK